MYIYIQISKLGDWRRGDRTDPFSIATTPSCRGGLLLSLDCSTYYWSNSAEC